MAPPASGDAPEKPRHPTAAGQPVGARGPVAPSSLLQANPRAAAAGGVAAPSGGGAPPAARLDGPPGAIGRPLLSDLNVLYAGVRQAAVQTAAGIKMLHSVAFA